MSNLPTANAVAEIAALIGDPARAAILSALMDGRAFTAGELAGQAGIGASTASGHLAKLMASGLILPRKQGRHRYYSLASPEIAQAMETLMGVAAAAPARRMVTGPRDRSLRFARTCYDHLAGQLGVAVTDAMEKAGHLRLGEEAGSITRTGALFLKEFGISLPASRLQCRACLDWSERRSHLAGQVGRALCERFFALGWIERQADGRAVRLTEVGRKGFSAHFLLPRHVLTSGAWSISSSN